VIKLLENLKSNKELLEKGKIFKYNYYLIESRAKINEDFKINNFSHFYQIEHINESERDFENENIKKAISVLKKIKTQDNNTNFYILRITIVDLTQREVKHPVTQLSQIVDPEIGIGTLSSTFFLTSLEMYAI